MNLGAIRAYAFRKGLISDLLKRPAVRNPRPNKSSKPVNPPDPNPTPKTNNNNGNLDYKA